MIFFFFFKLSFLNLPVARMEKVNQVPRAQEELKVCVRRKGLDTAVCVLISRVFGTWGVYRYLLGL